VSIERYLFAVRHMYVYPKLRLAYTYIPKNACTSFKRTFGTAQGWLGSTPSAHTMRVSWWLIGFASYPRVQERVVVIRDPFDRVLSAYLNRFLMDGEDSARDHAMKTGLGASLDAGSTADDVTFADFVKYLASTPNRRLNEHWRPQSDFLLGEYTRLIRFEHIPEDTAFLAELGLTLPHRGVNTSTIRQDLGSYWGDRKAIQLRKLRRRRRILPAAENMYDDRLRALVVDRFAADVDLVRRMTS
jgi:hypothetical protein